eukprot:CAMPEP_0114587580 /NCGR_PEP_ID=MMETSP0125-20121206/10514_1 /TAXON_ID=485358 ORGANISM="Aristerostoma sp., Strain ATCC 50986" /NCGR_SAMPLE_ID=MMETSP0125 /ASSEMBLY_ACC=CAM_ASM_000245 /LENGTH=120 /DNA_ID=CAMNT_0001783581 /DNA_START=858 /DNA_END=1220 /DNA_ORIENTATION=+
MTNSFSSNEADTTSEELGFIEKGSILVEIALEHDLFGDALEIVVEVSSMDDFSILIFVDNRSAVSLEFIDHIDPEDIRGREGSKLSNSDDFLSHDRVIRSDKREGCSSEKGKANLELVGP